MRSSVFINPVILIIASAWGFVSFYTYNITQGISTQHILLLCFFFTATALITFYAFSYFFRRKSKILNILVFLSVFFFLFSVIEQAITTIGVAPRYAIVLPIWFFLGAAVSFLLWRVSRDDQSTKPAFIILLSLYIVPLMQAAEYFTTSFDGKDVKTRQIHDPLEGAPSGLRPNVYFFVVDGYARADVLKQQLGYDNSWFLDTLEQRGFIVSSNSMSNYPMTTYSLASTFEMKYLLNEGDTERLHAHSFFHRFISGDNAVVQFFKSRDYSFIYFDSYRWTGYRCAEEIADDCLYPSYENIFLTNETVANLLKRTPLYKPVTKLARRMERGSKKSLHDVEVLNNYLSKYLSNGKQPLLLYAHFISPHPPNTYADDCSITNPELELQDWSDISGYISQVECVSRDLLKLITTIETQDDSSPIIVLQSDHGPATRDQFEKPLKQWVREDIVERYGMLNAVKIDSECKSHLYDSMSPVNTFRIVTACLNKTAPQLLPDVSYFTNYKHHPDDDLIEVIAEGGDLMAH